MPELKKQLDLICGENEYEKRADELLKLCGLEFRAVLIGSDCPMFCADAEKEIDMDKLDSFPRKTHIHGKHYRCTISGKERGHVSFDFWNSYADSEENAYNFGVVRGHCGHGFDCTCESRPDGDGILLACRENVYWDKYRGKKQLHYSVIRPMGKRKTVQAYDLLACLQKSDPGTFEDFCSDFGYDTDSRKAESTYHAVVKEWKKVSHFFTAEELTQVQEIQ
jgi:hypothetical protein